MEFALAGEAYDVLSNRERDLPPLCVKSDYGHVLASTNLQLPLATVPFACSK